MRTVLRWAGVLVLILAVVGVVAPSAVAGTKTVIKIGTGVAPDHPENIGARKIKELVEKKAGDRVEVQVFTDNQIGDQRTMVENLRNGTQEITWVTVGFFGSYEPILNVIESGYLFRDSHHSYKVFDGPMGDEIRALVEKHGVKLLGYYEAGLRHITNNVRPINTPADLKGLKIRTPQAKYHLNTLKYMGANPVAMSFGELYTAMQQKVVDGQENPLSNIYKAKFYEVNKYLSLTGHLHLTHMVMYSAKLWDKLPADLQKIVREAVIESQETQRKAVRDDDENLLKELKAKGMQVNEGDREAFRKAVLPLRDDAVKEFGPKAKEWIERIEATK
ncbi:MAG: C4-dicarboxylate transporter [candidate division NC10 bacterium RIFCSPLOWO2_12_FULL_66_18]|nr:MAG: C4-dicarboxylate transporter [candidate division NC10 bacterium RIFCSPLOWO2_12_FULL_66_18]